MYTGETFEERQRELGVTWKLRDQLFSEEHMFTRIKTIAELQNLTETYKALYYMREKHAAQTRKDLKFSDAKVPYIVHPLMMACHAWSMGLVDDELLAVILLHDVCEDCGVAPKELPFSANVREAVSLLTKRSSKEIRAEAVKEYREGKKKEAEDHSLEDFFGNFGRRFLCEEEENATEQAEKDISKESAVEAGEASWKALERVAQESEEKTSKVASKESEEEFVERRKREYTQKYYDNLQKNRLAALTKVIDRCNNISTMAQSFPDKKVAEYIKETETYVFPVLTTIKRDWPEYNPTVFLVKYHMLSVLESLKVMLIEK